MVLNGIFKHFKNQNLNKLLKMAVNMLGAYKYYVFSRPLTNSILHYVAIISTRINVNLKLLFDTP